MTAPFFPEWPALGPDEDLQERLDFNEAIRRLLSEEADVLFLLAGKSNGGESTIALFVGCNDLFYWACADCEPIPPVTYGIGKNEAAFWQLYDLVREHGPRGASLWCCLRRGMQPQRPIRERWKADGFWPVELDACAEPAPS